VEIEGRGVSTAGTLFLVVGPSGVGKDALIQAARPLLLPHGFAFPRRWITTLEDRGEDHIPVTCADFDEAVGRGFIDLHWSAHGLRYGIPASVRDDLSTGLHVIANASRSLMGEARARFAHLRIFHITAPMQLVRLRLFERGRENAAMIEERFQRAAPLAIDQDDVIAFSNHLPLAQSALLFVEAVLAARCC
jgi:phosphonate metabolism protein PhnN/1,5-bisphosphokinase (PRPP-forming)